jgi:cytochrome c2
MIAVSVTFAVAARPGEKAQARRGEIAYRKCYACHALEPGKQLEGPSLHRIVGRRIAAERGFAYSPALRALGRRHMRWDTALLDRYIADPERVAPRTSMNFHGIRDRGERADLIYYLDRVARR